MGFSLFSARLKEVIDKHVAVKLYRWVKTKIKDVRTNEITTYYLPLFEHLVDTINYENSKCRKDRVMVPCYSLKKIKKLNLDFFPKHDEMYNKTMGEETPYFVDRTLIVSYQLQQIIKKSDLVGVAFTKVVIIDDTETGDNKLAYSVTKNE
jgi:hypothetical protein